MPTSFDILTHNALALPEKQRLSLAHRLLRSVDPAPDSSTEKDWKTEITKRIAQSDAGEMEAIPAKEVFARLRKITAEKGKVIDHFTLEQLAEMRAEFAALPIASGVAISDSLDDFLAECSTAAVQQIARAGIRVFSMAAFITCWKRGTTA